MLGRKKYLLRLIKIGPDEHKHRVFRTDELFFKITEKINDEDKELNFSVKDFYTVKHDLVTGFFIWFFTGLNKEYLIVINSEGEIIKEVKPEISGKVLKVARDWRGLDKAINSAFPRNLEIPKIGYAFLIIGAIIILYLLIKSGWIPMPGR